MYVLVASSKSAACWCLSRKCLGCSLTHSVSFWDNPWRQWDMFVRGRHNTCKDWLIRQGQWDFSCVTVSACFDMTWPSSGAAPAAQWQWQWQCRPPHSRAPCQSGRLLPLVSIWQQLPLFAYFKQNRQIDTFYLCHTKLYNIEFRNRHDYLSDNYV